MSLTFDKPAHLYTYNGEIVPSITQIMGFVGFYAHMDGIPKDRLDHAAERGEAIHLATQYYDEGDLDISTVSDECRPYVDAYIAWRERTRWTLIECEKPRYALGYAGTPDRIFADNLASRAAGRCIVLDIKTSWKVSKEAHIQTAAQAVLWDPQDCAPLPRRIILHLTKDGEANEVESVDDNDYAVWDAALQVYKWIGPKGKRKKRGNGDEPQAQVSVEPEGNVPPSV